MTTIDPPVPNGVLRYRVERLEREVEGVKEQLSRIEDKIDRASARWVAAIFTFSGAVLLLALNLVVLREGG